MSGGNNSKAISTLPYVNLMIISLISSIYRAYANDDIQMVVFFTIFVVAYYLSTRCSTELDRLPPDDDSLKKFLLKITNWVLASLILFSFAYQYATILSLTASVIVFVAVTAANATIFYVYFIYDDKKTTATNLNDNNAHKTTLLSSSV